jgi:toxin CcdB
MARFDVYENPDLTERELIPYLLDIQNDYLYGLTTRLVAPLWSSDKLPHPLTDLNPEFNVSGQSVTMDTSALGSIPFRLLRAPVANLQAFQLTIQNALDALFGGY